MTLQWLPMPDADKPSDSPHDRRAFFRRSLKQIVSPAADYLASRIPGMVPVGTRPLRPPGAMLEPEFLNTCYRCGSCADHCPADSITLIESDDRRLQGTPTIDPTRRACVVCDDLACMKVCPSGALKLVDRGEIRIGLAVWDPETCLRTDHAATPTSAAAELRAATVRKRRASQPEGQLSNDDDALQPADGVSETPDSAEDCTICVDVCPYGTNAIRIEANRIRVMDPRESISGCTGCGVCQEQCPTRPKRAIRVLPYALPKET